MGIVEETKEYIVDGTVFFIGLIVIAKIIEVGIEESKIFAYFITAIGLGTIALFLWKKFSS